jgi:hypothetical protein
MKRSYRFYIPMALSLLVNPLAVEGADAVVIRFAQSVDVIQNVTDAENGLGAPDALFSGFTGPSLEVPGEAVFSEFTEEVTYSTAGLAALLQVPQSLLLDTDAIAVEVGGVPSVQSVTETYETSTHSFADGTGSRIVSNVYLGPFDAEIVSRSVITASAYDAFFGTTTPPPANGAIVYAFLLFDFGASQGDAIDPLSPSFTWRVLGADLNLGSPDPEFFGVLVVPEPSTFALAMLGLGALAARRHRAAR